MNAEKQTPGRNYLIISANKLKKNQGGKLQNKMYLRGNSKKCNGWNLFRS